jgi:signal transduction histidine kinase
MLGGRSLLRRIVALHVAAVLIAAICLPAALYLMLSGAAASLQEGTLTRRAEAIFHHLRRGADGGWTLDLPPWLRDGDDADERYQYAVLDGDGRVLFTSIPDGGTLAPPATGRRPAGPAAFKRRLGGAHLYGVSVPFELSGAALTVQVAENLDHLDVLVDDVVAQFLTWVGWITAPILLLLLAVEIGIVRRALSPLLRASALAARIGPASADIRLPETDMPRELFPLVHAVNEALARLERGFRMQREFAADAAHELRTPLAILQARIDMVESAALKSALGEDCDAIGRLVGQLLAIAELESFAPRHDEVADLRAVCTKTAAYVAPLAERHGRQVAVEGVAAPVFVHGNAETLGQAVRNLVENALAHTPPGGTAALRVTREPAIYVADHGPGIPAAERDLVFRRFWRRDRARPGSSGLGLAIVARIAEAHRGARDGRGHPGRRRHLRHPLRSRRRDRDRRSARRGAPRAGGNRRPMIGTPASRGPRHLAGGIGPLPTFRSGLTDGKSEAVNWPTPWRKGSLVGPFPAGTLPVSHAM